MADNLSIQTSGAAAPAVSLPFVVPEPYKGHPGRKRDPRHTLAVVYRYAYSLRSMRVVGREFGLSYERVRQLCDASGIDVKRQRERTKVLVEAKRMREMRATAQPCVFCGEPNLRGVRSSKFVTCSSACAEQWKTSKRYHTSDDRRDAHRLSNARSVLAHSDKRPPAHVLAAQRFLAHYEATGEVPPPNRRFSQKGRDAVSVGRKRAWDRKRAEEQTA